MTFNETTEAIFQIKKRLIILHEVVPKDELRTYPELLDLRKELIALHYKRINILQGK